MKWIIKLLLFFGFCCCSQVSGQLDTYGNKQEIEGISDQWHKITLPNAVFNDLNADLSDIRIYGPTENDTLEAPYILEVASGKDTQKDVEFDLLNTTSNGNGYYFTYEIPATEAINKIQLDFKEANFDWQIVLKGSQDQKEWFTILNEYRILSIKNEQTDYTFADLDFPSSKYRYYRLLVKTKNKPELASAKIILNERTDAKYSDYPVTFMNIKKQDKNTIIDIDLKKRLPLSYLKLNIADEIDYYRPILIEYVSDSTKTEKGWKYSYRKLTTATLTSLENKVFRFESTIAQKLRLTIQNHDNRPLEIESAEAKGYIHTLIARFTEDTIYYLTYGNKDAQKPYYDIVQSAGKIPDNLSELSLSEVERIPKKKPLGVSPLFENKLWLWAVMGVVILVLGWFTVRMMNSSLN